MYAGALHTLLALSLPALVHCFCGENIRWSHQVSVVDVYGMWYGAGYAQHTPDRTNKPNEVGCVTLFISDITGEPQDDWLDWSMNRNYVGDNWPSYKSNPWSGNSMSGSGQDIPRERRKRDMYDERRLRVMWDEDGQTLEQIYVYSPDEPGLWVADQLSSTERAMKARGIDIWQADEPPRHPQVIRVLKVTPHMMIINHCSDLGGGGVFSLILRRSPSPMAKWEWYDYQRQFFSFDLPNMYRYFAICKGCVESSSVLFILICFSFLVLLGGY